MRIHELEKTENNLLKVFQDWMDDFNFRCAARIEGKYAKPINIDYHPVTINAYTRHGKYPDQLYIYFSGGFIFDGKINISVFEDISMLEYYIVAALNSALSTRRNNRDILK